MRKISKLGFTLIELLAVIIILAVIALIATPVVLKVVDNAKESARKSSVSGYADTVRLALVEKQFETGVSPNIDQVFLDSLSYQGEKVSCDEVINSSKYSVVLHECNVGSDTKKYCFAMGKVYDCNDDVYTQIYEDARNNTNNEDPDDENPEIEYKDNSGANQPDLYDKMIPVIYNTNTGKWKYANLYEKWYDYNAKEWANAVVLNSSVTYSEGQDIEMTDIAMMYVWIPRYKYIIFNGNNGSIAPKEIDITFENGIAKTGTVSCEENVQTSGGSSETCIDTLNGSIVNNTSTYTHPAFTFGTQELNGIWVGKFEISTDDNACLNTPTDSYCNNSDHTIVIKPNVDSLRWTNLSNLFTSISNIKTKYSMNNINSHMIKNVEWGAVSYLTQSKYGRCTSGTCEEITINNVVNSGPNYYRTHTGCAGGEVNASSIANCPVANRYETEKGIKASTTGNIYGIYDMSGGADEYVMGNMVNSSGQFPYSSITGYFTFQGAKYHDTYTYDSFHSSYGRGKLGDATKETANWYNDYGLFPNLDGYWFKRGGYAGGTINSGIFNFSYYTNIANSHFSSRSVIVAS